MLFSAVSLPPAELRTRWTLHDVALLTSAYALEEAQAYLREHPQQERLRDLLDQVKVVSAVEFIPIKPWVATGCYGPLVVNGQE